MRRSGAMARRDVLKSGLLAAGAGLWPEALFTGLARADEEEPSEAATIGRRELVKGLDGMSRVADQGNDPFTGGHNAAAVMASAFFCREQKLGEGVQKELLALVKARLLTSRIYEPRPKQTADQWLVEGLVKDLDAGIDTLRRSGHNIIFANICLKAMREVHEAATPARVAGLRRMVQSFGTRRADGSRSQDGDTFVDLGDETRFVHFVFEEYLKAMDLYLIGKGYHGFAGHLLTVGHALLELRRAGTGRRRTRASKPTGSSCGRPAAGPTWAGRRSRTRRRNRPPRAIGITGSRGANGPAALSSAVTSSSTLTASMPWRRMCATMT